MASSLENVVPTTMEFAVDINDHESEKRLKSLIKNERDIKLLDIDLKKQQVILETKLPSGLVQNLLEKSGNTVVFRGHGYSQGMSQVIFLVVQDLRSSGHIAAAVVHVMGDRINGVVRLVQTSEDCCVIDGAIDGLPEGKHGLHINTLGDLSNGCQSTGIHFNPTNEHHGNRLDNERHVGDLGNIESNHERRSIFRFQDDRVKVWDVIGRSLVVDEDEDKFDHDITSSSSIACGIIARSAGLFENIKKVCQCSGKTLWEERKDVKETLTSQL